MRPVTIGRVFRRTSLARPAGRGRGPRLHDPRRRRARVPRRRRRRDRRQRRPRPARDRRRHGRPGRSPGLCPRQRLHDRAARGVCPRGRRPPAARRPGDLPGVGRLGGDRDGAQAGPRLPPRARRDRALDRLRALGQLSRQHARRARPVRSQAAPPAVRGLARPLPACLGGLSVSGRGCRAPTRWRPPTISPPSSSGPSRRRVPAPSPRSSPSRSSARPWPRSSRPTATGRPSPTSAAGTACCSSPTRS